MKKNNKDEKNFTAMVLIVLGALIVDMLGSLVITNVMFPNCASESHPYKCVSPWWPNLTNFERAGIAIATLVVISAVMSLAIWYVNNHRIDKDKH